MCKLVVMIGLDNILCKQKSCHTSQESRFTKIFHAQRPTSSQSQLHDKLDWAVIAAHDVVVDPGLLHVLLEELLRHYEVVQPPTKVLGSRTAPHRPVGILHLCRMKSSECVNPSCLEEVIETIALFDSETCTLEVTLWVSDVDLFVTDVQVPTPDDRLFCLQLIQIFLELDVPLLDPVVEPDQLFSSVGDVGSYEVEGFEFQCQDSSLLRVVRTVWDILRYRDGVVLREDGDPRVSRSRLAEVPVVVVVVNHYICRCMSFLVDLGLIDAEEVGVQLLQVVLQFRLVHHCSDPVDIPARDHELRRDLSISYFPPASRGSSGKRSVSSHELLGLILGRRGVNHFFGEYLGLLGDRGGLRSLEVCSLGGTLFGEGGGLFGRHAEGVDQAGTHWD